ncbi:MAG TPA: 3-deoxy-manno-octulosonate cytidylyltransferase [Nevskiales bacterium]|nr:3-deoxy-manno-octulosonate cytidylyltransferase [Nevskiales bacterium]
MKPGFRVVIPARLASTRLPRKVLRLLQGRPMLEHVYRVAQASGAQQVVVATDDEQVAAAVRAFGGEVCLTDPAHPSGTDRVNEAARRLGWNDDVIVVNLQGDEPLMPPALLAQAARGVQEAGADIATLAGRFDSLEEWRDPNVVKVVRDAAGFALYFSRAPIPWDRDGFAAGAPALPQALAWRHIGLYAYRAGTLRRFSALPPAPIERREALEQLRALHHGLRIHVGIAAEKPGPGVDTEDDLRRVEGLLAVR